MSGNTLILPLIAAIIVFLLYMIAIQLAGKKETVRERVQRISGLPDDRHSSTMVDPLRTEHDYSPVGLFLSHLLNAVGINTENFRKHSQLRFYRAGVQSPDAPIYYLFCKYICAIVCLLLAVWLVFSYAATTMDRLQHWMIAIILVVVGLMGPDLYLTNQRAKREKVLLRAFPDALDLLLVCVESGLALDGALARVCKELGRAKPEITVELNRTRLELTMLNDRAQALSNLAERTDMLPFRSLVTTLLQSERFGTSLTDTLRVLSEDYRNTRLMMAEEKAGRLPALITIPLICFLLPALFLIILGPAIITVMDTIRKM